MASKRATGSSGKGVGEERDYAIQARQFRFCRGTRCCGHRAPLAVEGEVRHQAGAPDVEVEACFARAIEWSSRQQAKSFELSAAMSLARLWRDQGRHRDAFDLVEPIYEWFTEGFDTADLKETKVLLDELT